MCLKVFDVAVRSSGTSVEPSGAAGAGADWALAHASGASAITRSASVACAASR